MSDVLHIEVHPILKSDLVPAAHLPQAGEAGANRQAPTLPRLVLCYLSGQGRPRTDDAHLAAQHVDELRELVDAELADEATHRRDARVFLDLEDRAILLVFVEKL